jgi:hypothetical protein
MEEHLRKLKSNVVLVLLIMAALVFVVPLLGLLMGKAFWFWMQLLD